MSVLEMIAELKSEVLRVSECSKWKDDKIQQQAEQIQRLENRLNKDSQAFQIECQKAEIHQYQQDLTTEKARTVLLKDEIKMYQGEVVTWKEHCKALKSNQSKFSG